MSWRWLVVLALLVPVMTGIVGLEFGARLGIQRGLEKGRDQYEAAAARSELVMVYRSDWKLAVDTREQLSACIADLRTYHSEPYEEESWWWAPVEDATTHETVGWRRYRGDVLQSRVRTAGGSD